MSQARTHLPRVNLADRLFGWHPSQLPGSSRVLLVKDMHRVIGSEWSLFAESTLMLWFPNRDHHMHMMSDRNSGVCEFSSRAVVTVYTYDDRVRLTLVRCSTVSN